MADRPKFDVSLVTPDGAAFEGEAEMLVVPGAAGEIGVLARHAPLVATLKAGSTRVYRSVDSEDVLEFATGPGFFQVQLDRAIARFGHLGAARQLTVVSLNCALDAIQANADCIVRLRRKRLHLFAKLRFVVSDELGSALICVGRAGNRAVVHVFHTLATQGGQFSAV